MAPIFFCQCNRACLVGGQAVSTTTPQTLIDDLAGSCRKRNTHQKTEEIPDSDSEDQTLKTKTDKLFSSLSPLIPSSGNPGTWIGPGGGTLN